MTGFTRLVNLRIPMTTRQLARGLFAIAGAMFSVPSYGQAWVAPKGELSLSLSYQYTDFPGHLDVKGDKDPVAGTEAQGFALQLDYGVNDRLAFSANIPYTATRTVAPLPPKAPPPEVNDDQRYHSTWQDYQFTLRYNLISEPFVLTPFAALVLPSHDYVNVGEAVVGRGLRETHLGLNAGRVLDPLLENAYVDAHLAYVFSEKDLGISTNRAVADLALGYFVTSRFSARLLASYQRTHGGLSGKEVFGGELSDELFKHHDRLVRANFLRAGIAGSYSVTPQLDVYAAFITVVSGTDTHYGRGISIGVSRTFFARR